MKRVAEKNDQKVVAVTSVPNVAATMIEAVRVVVDDVGVVVAEPLSLNALAIQCLVIHTSCMFCRPIAIKLDRQRYNTRTDIKIRKDNDLIAQQATSNKQ